MRTVASRLLFKQSEWHLIKPFSFRKNNMNKIHFTLFLALSLPIINWNWRYRLRTT